MKKKLLFIGLFLLHTGYILIAQKTFDGNGGSSTDFYTNANWDDNMAPPCSSSSFPTNLIIDSDCIMSGCGSNMTFGGSLTINSGKTYTYGNSNWGKITGAFTNNGTYVANGVMETHDLKLSNGGTNTNNGIINITTGRLTCQQNGVILDNNGTINVNGAALLTWATTSTLNNLSGANINTSGSGHLLVIGGTMTINNASTMTLANTSNTNSLENLDNTGGLLILNASASMGSSTDNTGGTIRGTGTIISTSANLGGSVEPGGSVGTLNTTNDIEFSGTIEIEVDNGSSYDVINSTNSDALTISSATINFTFNGTSYNNGQSFSVFTNFGSVTAPMTISNNNGYTIVHSGNGVFQITAGAVPVELINFSARASKDQVNLSWQTASETNNKGFEVEHSFDNRTWSKIGFVSGEGTSYQHQSYSFLHENPAPAVNYYRLKQIDYDGAFEYSDVVSVELSAGDFQFSVAPNPVHSGELTLYFPEDLPALEEAESIQMQLFDYAGRMVQQQILNGHKEIIIVKDLAPGIYHLQVKIDDQQFFERVVIQ